MKSQVRYILKDPSKYIHWLALPALAVISSLWPTLSTGIEKLQFDAGDTLLNLYFLEHAYQHFINFNIFKPDLYWSPDFFWPIKNILAWSDHLLGPSVLYGVFRIGLEPVQSYVAWLALTLGLNYISIRAACKKISPETAPIWISLAALLTIFSPVVLEQISHPQLLSLYLYGPILWYCHKLINQKAEVFTIDDWASLASWILANAFFNIYTCIYAAYGALICSLIHLAKRAKTHSWRVNLGEKKNKNLAVLATIISLNVVIYLPYLNTLKIFGKRPGAEIITNLPKLASWLTGSTHSLIPPPFTLADVSDRWVFGAEQLLFPGWGLCMFLAATLVTSTKAKLANKTELRYWLLVITLLVVGSISIGDFTIWPYISKLLPGASSLRASSRVAIVIILYSAPALCLASANWKVLLKNSYNSICSILVIIGSYLSVVSASPPSFSFSNWHKEKTSISKILKKSDCKLFWYEWKDQPPWRAQVLAMHVQLETGIPTANGYSGHFPRDNWPFLVSSGNHAFKWIRTKHPEKYHKIKDDIKTNKWCIVEHMGSNSQMSFYNPSHPIPTQTKWIKTPNEVVYSSRDIKIAQKHGFLYFANLNNGQTDKWIQITRENIPIPADRGNFRIIESEILITNGSKFILITDQNKLKRIKYIWRINPITGEFIDQTMTSF